MFSRTGRLFATARYPLFANQVPRSTYCVSAAASPASTLPLHPEEALQTDNASGWAPPLGPVSDLPFTFFRTENSQLPVYHRRRKHNTQFLTVVRKYRGDVNALHNALRELVGPEAKIKQYQGRIEIQGDYRNQVQIWMRRLGF